MKVLKLAKNISNKKWFFWSSLIAEQEGSRRKTLLCWSFMEQLLFSFFFASMASKEILLLEEMLFVLIEWWLCKSHSHQRSVNVWKLIQFLREEISFWTFELQKLQKRTHVVCWHEKKYVVPLQCSHTSQKGLRNSY